MLNKGLPLVMSFLTISVQKISRLTVPSRSIRRPVVWSICASISTMPTMPVSRMARAGCNAGNSCTCLSTSGEALNSTQLTPSPLTQIEDWVRRLALMVPLRMPSQLWQLQFHWGKPPPAPEPKTWICISYYSKQNGPSQETAHDIGNLAVTNVHGYFKPETHFGSCWFGSQ